MKSEDFNENCQNQILKKYIFFTQGSPLWVSGDLSTSFWEGFIFKLESSGFHQTSSFCDLHPHVNAKNPTPKC